MICPKCKAKSKIIDTRFRKDTCSMYRRHECPKCGFRFTTREIYAKDYTKPKAYIREGIK